MSESQILSELKALRKDLNYLKSHMVDADSILTEEDYLDLKEYRKEKQAGKLTSHDELKKKLGL